MINQKYFLLISVFLLTGFCCLCFGVEKKSATPKTVITGKRMNLIDKGKAVEFVGGVKLRRGSDFLSADRMVSDEKRGVTRAWGRVYLRRDLPEEGVLWEAWGERAVYDSHEQSGTLWGKPKKPARVTRKVRSQNKKNKPKTKDEKEGNLKMEADKLVLLTSTDSQKGNVSQLDCAGRVFVRFEEEGLPHKRETRVWSNRLFYDGLKDCIRFWEVYPSKGLVPVDVFDVEQPVAVQSEENELRHLTGETIVCFVEDQRLTAEENVTVVIEENK